MYPEEAAIAGEFTRILIEATHRHPTLVAWTLLGLALLMLDADRLGWATLARPARR